MTERIDHVAEARSHLVNWVSEDFHASIAQVHATLALVEQQRISNLIAYFADWTDDELLDVDAEIREGLRL